MAEFSDGSPLASQWPIPPLHFFDYEVQVPSNAAGTYFYHSHAGIQALTAMGALIVEDCRGVAPYDYDDERVLLWHEHFRQNDSAFEKGLVSAPLQFGGEVVAVMMNGRGVAINKTAGDSGASDTSCQLPLIEVEPGKTYRFRFIGATSLAHSVIKFEDHENLTVIGVDGGQYTQPATTDRMQIASGQRFSVLFQTKTAEELQALGQTDFYFQFETRDRPSVYRGYGVLRYTNINTNTSTTTTTTTAAAVDTALPAAPATPIFNLPNITYDWLESTLQPLYPDPSFPSLSEVTRRVVINASQIINPSTNQTIWTLNDLSWNEHIAYPVPLLVDIYLRGDAALPDFDLAVQSGSSKGWDPRTKSYPARVGEVLEIVFQNTGSQVNQNGGIDVHPFHAHGQHYYDLGSGNGSYDAEAVEAARLAANYTPVKRDTTMLYRYETRTVAGAPAGWRAWRFRVTDPGVWMIHCHILQHMIMGKSRVSPSLSRLCINSSQCLTLLLQGCKVSGQLEMPARSCPCLQNSARDTSFMGAASTAMRPGVRMYMSSLITISTLASRNI